MDKKQNWKPKLHKIIYEYNTTAGKDFDVTLRFLIVASIKVVMLDCIPKWYSHYGNTFL